jgi:hypothetical protein
MSDIRARKLAGVRVRRKRFANAVAMVFAMSRADFWEVKIGLRYFQECGCEIDAHTFFAAVIFSA